LEKAKAYREQMIEAVAEHDDHLFEKFVHGDTINNDEIMAGIRKATIAQKIFPVICGSCIQEQGRAEPAGCRRRLPALARGSAAGAGLAARRPVHCRRPRHQRRRAVLRRWFSRS
jgi:hypothetical protein